MQKMARNVLAAGIIVIFNSLSVASVITEDITTSMLFSGEEVAFTIEKFFDGPEEEWNNTYGGEDYDAFFSIAETDNGDLVGFGTINGSGYYRGGDFFLVKTNELGNIEWQRSYGGGGTDFGQGMVPTSDGGYALLGFTSSYDIGGTDIWLVKTDANGIEQWNRTYGGRSFEQSGKSIVQTADGGFVFVGLTQSFSADRGQDAWVIEVDAQGNELWNKTYGSANNDEHFWDIEATADSGYVMTGFLHNKSTLEDYAWVVKTDVDGNLQWEHIFGPANQGLDLQQTHDGGYVLIAEVKDTVFGGHLNAWMVKMDATGSEEWNKLFISPQGENNFAVHHHVYQLSDGGYILTGITNGVTPILTVGDLWLTRTDAEGHVLWEKVIQGQQYDTTYCVDVTTDGGYIIAGATKSFENKGDFDAWLVKISDFDNNRPSTPARPNGPSSGSTGTPYTFTTTATESDGDQLYYMWNWGDGNYSDWLGPYASDVTCEATYTWQHDGSYNVRAIAKDMFGGESEWSEPLPVSMPYEHHTLMKLLMEWLLHLLGITFP